jgi:hypothetical protein
VTPRPRPRAPADSPERGIQQLEGYLLWQAEKERARAEAEAFAHRLPWLTGEQRRQVTHHYAELRLADTLKTLEHLRERSRELRIEYSLRYEHLRRRLLHAAAYLAVSLLLLDALLVLTLSR